MFHRLRDCLVAALIVLSVAASTAQVEAAAADYRFEVVGPAIQTGARATVTIRLVNVRTNQPVTNAQIFQQRLEMPHGGSPMTAIVAPAQSDGQGNYRFAVQTSMDGEWTLNFVARVPGESEAVRAAVPIRSSP